MNQEFNNGCGEHLFRKLYGIVKGYYEIKNIGLSSSLNDVTVKNECTDKHGSCYDLYQEINKLEAFLEKLESNCECISDESKIKQLTFLYEQVLFIMCKKMFFYGMLMKKAGEPNSTSNERFNKNMVYGIGDRIKRIRKSIGYTQQQVAEALHVSRFYEKNKIIPDLNTIIKLSKIFNVSYRCLLDDEDTGMFLD